MCHNRALWRIAGMAVVAHIALTVCGSQTQRSASAVEQQASKSVKNIDD
jgi:hypothetical protein